MGTQQTITSLPMSPAEDRRKRMIGYSLAMGIRMVCVVLCFFAQGWWLVLPVLGAILLPYFAVVLANTVSTRRGAAVERPGGLVVYGPVDARGGKPVIVDDDTAGPAA